MRKVALHVRVLLLPLPRNLKGESDCLRPLRMILLTY